MELRKKLNTLYLLMEYEINKDLFINPSKKKRIFSLKKKGELKEK